MSITRVRSIGNDRVILKNLTRGLRDRLFRAGHEVETDGHGSPSIRFEETDGDIMENASLVGLLVFLANQGVAFEQDFKQTFPPSYALQYLRERGLYKGKILACGYDGHAWVFEEI